MLAISGMPGCGKTTLIGKIAEELKKRSVEFYGILTPEIREKRRRIGFELVNVRTGEKCLLAGIGVKSNIRVGKYGINPGARDFILKALKGRGILLFDEIGPMELKILPELPDLIRDPAIVTVHRTLAGKFGAIWLTRENFDRVLEEALRFALRSAELFLQ